MAKKPAFPFPRTGHLRTVGRLAGQRQPGSRQEPLRRIWGLTSVCTTHLPDGRSGKLWRGWVQWQRRAYVVALETVGGELPAQGQSWTILQEMPADVGLGDWYSGPVAQRLDRFARLALEGSIRP